MTAVQPFSYLTAGPAPPKSAFRKPEDLDESAASAGSPSEDLSAPQNADQLGQTSLAIPYQLDFQQPQVSVSRTPTETGYDLRQQRQQQPVGAVYTGNRQDGVVANGYNRPKQWESPVTIQRKPSEATHAKRPPDVASKHTKALDPPCMTEKVESPNRDGVKETAKALHCQLNPLNLLAVDRPPENTKAIKEPAFGNANNHHGNVSPCRGPDIQDARKVMLQGTPNYCNVPSYTQPTRSFGVLTCGEMESLNGGSNSSQPEPDNRTRELPTVDTTESLNIFENFILVGPEKPPSKETAPKEPVKRLKLQELFDPPPLPTAASQDLHKVSILGVTNTESCDYRSTTDYSKSKDSDRAKDKRLVSRFDNPDYNLQRAYAASGAMHGFSDDRSWSARANNVFDEAGNSSSSSQRRPAKGRCVSRRLCIAVLITALLASIVCLGAGFIAGWFGRGRALGL